jgi:hypothetical protein
MEFGRASIASLKGGFPPKAIRSDASTSISTLFSNQEHITVEFAEAATMASKSTNCKGKKGDRSKTIEVLQQFGNCPHLQNQSGMGFASASKVPSLKEVQCQAATPLQNGSHSP